MDGYPNESIFCAVICAMYSLGHKVLCFLGNRRDDDQLVRFLKGEPTIFYLLFESLPSIIIIQNIDIGWGEVV